jgi:hypothetical protein
MAQRFIRFYGSAWRSDVGLRLCSEATRGIWIDMISIMIEAEPHGYLMVPGKAGKAATAADVAALCNSRLKIVESAINELKDRGVCSITEDGVIYCRRLIKDKEKQEQQSQFGKGGGNPSIIRGTVPKEQRTRPFSRSDNPAKTKRIFDRDDGKCHWCRCVLSATGELLPNTFHVDHVVAIRDGGTSDESNLVAACAECNHRRARHDGSDVNPGSSSGNNPGQSHGLNAGDDSLTSVRGLSRARATTNHYPLESSTPLESYTPAARVAAAFVAAHEAAWPSFGELRLHLRWPAQILPDIQAWLDRGLSPDRMAAILAAAIARWRRDADPPKSIKPFARELEEAAAFGAGRAAQAAAAPPNPDDQRIVYLETWLASGVWSRYADANSRPRTPEAAQAELSRLRAARAAAAAKAPPNGAKPAAAQPPDILAGPLKFKDTAP